MTSELNFVSFFSVKTQKEEKADTPSSVDQSPGTILSGRGRGKGVKRPKKQKGAAPAMNQQMQNNQMPMQNNQMPMQSQQQQMQNNQMQSNQMHMQMNMQVNCEDCTNEEMLIEDASDPQSQMNPNMQQFQSNQMMNQVPGAMGGVLNAQQSGMGFVPPGAGQMGQMGGPGGQQLPQQQQWQQGGFNPIQQHGQQPHGQQQFYNQAMPPQSKFYRKNSSSVR